MARWDDEERYQEDEQPLVMAVLHCVECGAPLTDGTLDAPLPQARYGPPALDWLVRCPACFFLLTGAETHEYVPDWPRRDKIWYKLNIASNLQVPMEGDRRVAAWEHHLRRQAGLATAYDYQAYINAAYPVTRKEKEKSD